MKVLQINCHYNYGSTGKIMYDINNYLEEIGIDSIQCYARGKSVNKERVYRIANETICKIGKAFNYVNGDPFSWGNYSTRNVIKIIEKEKPDIVHIHCINAYALNIYKLLEYLKKSGQKTVITLHAEFMYTGSCAYAFDCNQWRQNGCRKCSDKLRKSAAVKKSYQNWSKMYNAFKGFNHNNIVFASVSPWLEARAAESIILKGFNHITVLNGIDTETFEHKSVECENRIREKYNLGNKKLLLHVTSDFDAPIKGGSYVRKLAENLNKMNMQDYKIIVVGPARAKQNGENIQFIGIVKNQNDLATLYSASDMTVLTSEKETFSMICAETLCCGTPLVGFLAGAPETIAIADYSDFVPFGDLEALCNSVKKMASKEKISKKDIELAAKEKYSYRVMAQNYVKLYKDLINDNTK